MTQDGPAVEIDFWTLKGHDSSQARKEEHLLLMVFPVRNNCYFADAAAYLFVLACVSDVFIWPTDSITAPQPQKTPRQIPMKHEASIKPVFAAERDTASR